MAKQPDFYLVRLKPYNPKRGCVLRTYSVFGRKFLVTGGWYKVDHEVAEYLRTVRQVATDPNSPDAFDVCTEKQAQEIERKEKADKRGTPATPIPIDLTNEGVAAQPRRDVPVESVGTLADVAGTPTPEPEESEGGGEKDAADKRTVTTKDLPQPRSGAKQRAQQRATAGEA